MTEKIKQNEKVANAVNKINQNEYVKKVNKYKYSKFIKIGATIIAVILIFLAGYLVTKTLKKQRNFLYLILLSCLKMRVQQIVM